MKFLITGVSLCRPGLRLAALAAGHTVIGTVRNEAARKDFEDLAIDRAIALVLEPIFLQRQSRRSNGKSRADRRSGQ